MNGFDDVVMDPIQVMPVVDPIRDGHRTGAIVNGSASTAFRTAAAKNVVLKFMVALSLKN